MQTPQPAPIFSGSLRSNKRIAKEFPPLQPPFRTALGLLTMSVFKVFVNCFAYLPTLNKTNYEQDCAVCQDRKMDDK